MYSSENYLYSITAASLPTEFLEEEWLPFLVYCFSSKPNPPTLSYFQNHLIHDPYKTKTGQSDIVLIVETPTPPKSELIGITKSGRSIHDFKVTGKVGETIYELLPVNILSTYRVFNRNLTSFVDTAIKGLGEVCTSSDSRGEGLSTILLIELISKSKLNKSVVILHASEMYQGYYEKLGYSKCASLRSSILKFVNSGITKYTFKDEYDNSDSEASLNLWKERFTGFNVINRTSEYFNKWIKSDSGRWGSSTGTGYCGCFKEDVLVGYLILRVEEGKEVLQIRDLAIKEGEEVEEVLGSMVFRIVNRELMTVREEIVVNVNEFILKAHRFNGDTEEGDVDEGWMWGGDEEGKALEEKFEMFPVDSF